MTASVVAMILDIPTQVGEADLMTTTQRTFRKPNIGSLTTTPQLGTLTSRAYEGGKASKTQGLWRIDGRFAKAPPKDNLASRYEYCVALVNVLGFTPDEVQS